MRNSKTAVILIGVLASLQVLADGYYVCQDPKTGKKVGQDYPCQSGKALGSYDAVSPREQKAREASARWSKREFERLHPGTYRPEEYMTEEEYAAYLVKRKAQEEERRKQEDQQAVQDAIRRSERAEQRAIEAEKIAREAAARAAAAEEEARNRRLYPLLPLPPPKPPRITNCDRGNCRDDAGHHDNKDRRNTPNGPPDPYLPR